MALFLVFVLTLTGPVPQAAFAVGTVDANGNAEVDGDSEVQLRNFTTAPVTIMQGANYAGLPISLAAGTLTNVTLKGLQFDGGAFADATNPTMVNLDASVSLTLGSAGLVLPNNMVLTAGSIMLSSSQTWSVTADLGSSIDGARVGDANAPVRVDGFGAGNKTLTLYADGANDYLTTALQPTAVFLDVGPSIDVTKTGSGNLWLVLSTNPGAAFTGTLNITDGAVYLSDGYMTSGTSDSAPSITLAGVASLHVQNANTISRLDGSGTVYGYGGQGDLTINVASGGTASFTGKLMDGTLGDILSLRKTGKGSLSLTNALSNFSGGLFLDDGVLTLGANSTSGAFAVAGPYGSGELTVSGGTLRTNSAIRSLSNTINFTASGTQSAVQATVDASVSTGSLTLNADVNVQSETTLTLKAPLTIAGGLYGSFGLVKAGTSTLYINPSDASLVQVSSLTLREGTLVLNRDIDSNLIIAAVSGSAARSLTTGTSGITVAGQGAFALTLSSDFTYFQSAGALMDLSGASLTAVGGGTSGMANSGTVEVTVNSGTLALGNLVSALSNPAKLAKSGLGTLALKGTLGLSGLSVSAGTLLFNPAAATQTFAGVFTATGTSALSVAGGVNLVLSGSVAGGGFTKIGSGKLTLGGSNLYSGTLNLAAGTLGFSGSPTFGAAAQIAFASGGTGLIQMSGANASLNLVGSTDATNIIENGSVNAGAVTLTNSGTLAALLRDGGAGGALALVKSGTGTLVVSGTNTYTGGTNINAGILQPATAGALGSSGSITFTGGTLQLTSGYNADISGRFSAAAGQSFNIDTNAQNLTLASGFGGGSTFSKSGQGILTLSGDNSFTSLAITAGTVQVGAGGTTGSAGTGTITNTGILVFNRSDSYGGTFGGAISGTGAVQLKSGLLTLGGISSYSGTTTVTAGTLVVAGSLTGTSLVLGDATTGASAVPSLLLAGTSSLSRAVSVGASANSNAFTSVLGGANTSGTTTFAGAITLGTAASNYGVILQAANGGTTLFQGAWTTNNKPVTIGSSGNAGTVKLASTLATTGTVNVAYGTLAIGATNAIGSSTPLTLSGTVLDLGTFSTTAGAFVLNDGTVLGTGTLTATSYSAQQGTISGLIGGAGAFTKTGSGSVNFTGANPYSGVMTVNAGSLIFTGNGTTAGSIVNNGRVLFDSATDRTMAGALSSGTSSASFEKAGTSTLTISGGAANYTGATTISGGTLVLGGLIGSSLVQNNSTLKFALTSGGTFNGTVSGGVTILTATTPITLTLGSAAVLGGTVQIGTNVSLSLSSGAKFGGNVVLNGGTINFNAANAFSATTSALTINSGAINLGGFSQSITSLTTSGGSIRSSSAASIFYDNLTAGATAVGPLVTLGVNSKTETYNSGTGIRLLSGVLGTLATGGTYQFVDARSDRPGYYTLRFDQPIAAAGSVSATVNSGTFYALSVEAPVNTPLFYVQSGVSVNFTNSGSLVTSGTLSVDGEVTLSGTNGKAFGNIELQGGTFRNASDFSASATFTSLSATSGSLSATLAGSGSIVKSGTGTLSISGANSAYAGTLRIAAGTVALGDNSALGAGKVSLESGTSLLQLLKKSVTLTSLAGTGIIENGGNTPSILTLSPAAAMSVNTLLRDGQGGSYLSLVKDGSQTVTLLSSPTYTGSTTVAGGSLVIGAGVQLDSNGVMEITGGTLDLGGTQQAFTVFRLDSGVVGGGTLAASLEFRLKSGVVNAVLGGNGNLIVSAGVAGSTVTINSASTYLGTTTISGGTLSLGGSGRLGSTGSVTITGGLLELGSSSQSLANVILAGGAVSGGTMTSNAAFDFQSGTAGSILGGSAKLTKSGTGSVTLGAANSYTGGTQVDGGLLTLGVNGALPSSGSLTVSAGTVAFGSTSQGAGAVSLNGGSLTGGTLTATSYAATAGFVTTKLMGPGAVLTKSGTGTLTLNTASTYDGGTNVNQGTLVLGLNNALSSSGSISVGGGLLSLGSTSQTVGAVTLIGGSVTGGTLTGASYTLEAGNITSVLAGTGALTKQNIGTVVLSSANGFSGATTINAGTLLANTSGALGSTSAITVNGGLLNAVNYNTAATLSVGSSGSAAISGSGLSLAAVSNANTASNSVRFSATSGTITLAGLTGAGSTRFDSNAVISNGGIGDGNVSVAGLLTSEISGGIVSAGSLATTGTVSNGQVTVTGPASVANVSGGLVSVGGPATLGTVSGGTLNLSGASSVSSLLGGGIALSGNSVLTVSSGNFGGVISGSGSLVKAGTGSLSLSAAQTFNGITTLRAGGLFFTGSGNVAGALAVGNASTGAADAPTLLLSNSSVVTSTLTIGAGATTGYTATLGGSNTSGTAVFSGPVTLSAGTYNVVLQAATGGTVDFQGAWTTNGKGLTVGAAGNAGTVKISNTLTGAGLVSITNGSTLLAGANNIFGASTPVTVTGANLDLGAFSTSAGTVTLTSGNITGGNLTGTRYDVAAGTITSVLAGGSAVALNKTGAGTVTLSGANTYAGTTTVSAGTLAFEGAGKVAGAIVNNGNLLFNNTSDVTLSGSISGSGSLVKFGNTTLTLNGGASYTGATTISAGTLAVAGLLGSSVIQNDATLRLGLISSGTFNGNMTGNGATFLSANAGAVTLTLGSSANFGGSSSTVQINGGVTVSMDANARMLGNVIINGGTLNAIAANLSTDPSALTILSGNLALTINSVVTPTAGIYDVKTGVIATFTNTGALASGTLQIEGAVNLSGLAKSFSSIAVRGGNLTNGTLSGGSLSSTGGFVSTALGSGFGDILMNGTSTLTLSGASSTYAGTLHLVSGTVVLGGTSALGSGKVAFEGSSATPVLQLNGNNTTLVTLDGAPGSGIVENASATSATLTLNPASDFIFGGTLRDGGSGALALVKSGSASATLSGALSYSGGTTVAAGTLALQGSALPTGRSVTVSGGNLDLGNGLQNVGAFSMTSGATVNGTLTATSYTVQSGQLAAILAGSASFDKTSAGLAVLSGANTLSGAMQVQGGTLQISGGGKLSSGSLSVSNGASVDLGSSQQSVSQFTLVSGSVANGSLSSAAGYALQSGVVGAALGGTGNVVKTTASTVTLSGANTVSGITDVQAGTLLLTGSGKLAGGSLKVDGAARVDLGTSSQTVGGVSLVSGVINNGTLTGAFYDVQSGSVGVVLAGAGALTKTTSNTVTLNAQNTYTGGTTVSGGTLVLGVSGALEATGSLTVDAAKLSLGSTQQTVGAVSLRNGSILGTGVLSGSSYNMESGSVTVVLSGAGSLSKAGPGTLTLSGANTLSGLVDIAGGALVLSDSGALSSGSLRLSGEASLDLGGKAQSVGLVTLTSGTISNGTLSGSSYLLDAGSISTILGGSGALTKQGSGTVTMSALNTFSGAATLTAGTLLVRNGLSLSNASSVAMTGGVLAFDSGVTTATLRGISGDLVLVNAAGNGVALTLNPTADLSYTDVLRGVNGSLIKTGAYKLTLSGANTYTGSTTVNAGTLEATPGALASTTSISVNGATFVAADYNSAASLTVNSTGTAVISGSGLTVGTVQNANTAAASVRFTNPVGLITVGSLAGNGSTQFNSDATINSTISSGVVSVAGSLTASISGGTLSAGNLTSATLSGGSVEVAGAAAVTSMTGGVLSLQGSTGTISTLTGGNITLSPSAELRVEAGSFAGIIGGGGSLVKSGPASLTLAGSNTFAGATTVNGGSLLATVSGAFASTSSIAVNGALFSAMNYNPTASLSVDASGIAFVSGGNVSVGDVSNGNRVGFTAASGTVTLGSLSGSGVTDFGSDARILSGGVTGGSVNAVGRLVSGDITGGQVSARSLMAGTLSAGVVTLGSGASQIATVLGGDLTTSGPTTIGAVSSTGSLSFLTATSSIQTLSQGTIVLGPSATLKVTDGTATSDISGSGTLVKEGVGTTLTLNTVPASTVNIGVTGGTLEAGDLLSGSRTFSLSEGSNLNLTLGGDVVYSGTIVGGGSLRLTGSTPLTVSLGGSGILDGVLTLASDISLDVSLPNKNVFGDYAKLNILGTGTLFLGDTNQEVWLQQLNVAQTAAFLTIQGNGAKVLYDERPWFLDEENHLTTAGSAAVAISGAVSFDVLTKGGSIALSGGSYQYTAGRVRNRDGSPISGSVLLLDPEKASTVIRISNPVTFSQEVIAGGSSNQGSVSIQSEVFTPKITIGSGVLMTLQQAGTLQYGAADFRQTDIYNSGTFAVSVVDGEKTFSNVIRGTGSFAKLDAGTLILAGSNTYTGATTLSGGVLVATTQAVLGSGSLRFSGGTLRYAAGLGDTQVNQQILAAAGAVSFDTNGNLVTVNGSISGTGDLAKLGNGTLVVSGDSTGLVGAILVDGGTLQIGTYGSGGALPSTAGINVGSGAILRLARSEQTLLAQQITSAGTIEISGSGPVVLSGVNSLSGGVVLGAGRLDLESADALGSSGSLFFKGGTLRYGQNNTEDYSSRFSKAANEKIKIDTNGVDVEFASSIEGAGTTLYKAGLGTLVLSGANTYTGNTRVAAGTLQLVGEQAGASLIALNSGRLLYTLANAGTSTGSVVASAGTTVEFDVATTHYFSGSILGAGSVLKTGGGLLSLTNSLMNSGGLTLDAGSVTLSGSPAAAVAVGSLTLQNASLLNAQNGVISQGSRVSLLGTSTLQLGGDTIFLSSIDLGANTTIEVDPNLSATIFVSGTISDNRVTKPSNIEILALTGTIPTSKLRGNISNPSVIDVLEFGSGANLTFLNSVSSQSLYTSDDAHVTFKKAVSVSGAVLFSGGTVGLEGELRSLSKPVVIGSDTSAASVTLNGPAAAIVAESVQLNNGTLVLGTGALHGLQSVTTLQVGGPGGGAGDAVLKVLDGTGTLELGAGQTLKGSGTIFGNVTMNNSSSVLSPGNSPGTLSMGSLNLISGILQIDVSPAGQDHVDTQGNSVTIGSGATLRLVIYDGALKAGTTLSSIFVNGGTAVSTGTQTFGTVEFCRLDPTLGRMYSAMYGLSGDYTALSIVRKRFDATPGLSANAKGFASALDALVIDKGNTNPRLLEIGTGLTAAEAAARVPLQLAAASPAAYAELAGLSTQRTLNLNQGLVDHFNAVRKGVIEVPEGEYNVWTSGYGTWHKQNADAAVGSTGFSGSTWGDMFGIEKRKGDLLFGILGAGGHTSASFSSLPGSVATDSWHTGAYATAKIGAYVFETGAFVGMTDNSVRRTIASPGMLTQEGRMKPGGSEWLVQLGLARPASISQKLTLTPSLRLMAQGNALDAASETDLGGLEVKTSKQRTYTVLHQAGIEARRSFNMGSKSAAASLQMDWIHNYNSKGRDLTMALAGDSSTAFGYRGSDSGADALHLGAAFDLALTRRTTLRLSVDYQAQSEASVTRGALSLGYSF